MSAETLGFRVIVVEDEALISLHLQDMLGDLGCRIAGVYPSVGQAEAAVPSVEADIAVLDVNVAGREVFPIAEILAGRGIPMVFSTGYGAGILPDRWRAYPVVGKPFDPGALREGLIAAMSLR